MTRELARQRVAAAVVRWSATSWCGVPPPAHQFAGSLVSSSATSRLAVAVVRWSATSRRGEPPPADRSPRSCGSPRLYGSPHRPQSTPTAVHAAARHSPAAVRRASRPQSLRRAAGCRLGLLPRRSPAAPGAAHRPAASWPGESRDGSQPGWPASRAADGRPAGPSTARLAGCPPAPHVPLFSMRRGSQTETGLRASL